MNVQDYCNNVELELSCWKLKLEEVDKKIQAVPSINKYKMLGNIESLHIVLTELEDRINELRTSCPTEWNPVREDLSSSIKKFESEVDSVQKALFDYDFGG